MNKEEDLVGLSRSGFVNQMHAIKDSVTKSPPRYDMHGLTTANKLKWLFKNLTHLGNHHYKYQRYVNPELNNGIFRMASEPGKETTIALLSDWASDTPESHNIGQLASGRDYSIHLGDTYYVGNTKEIANNFNDAFGAPWPYGKFGSFALLGNHEMYSAGEHYFQQLLPYMGIYNGENTNQQQASFFCLENDHWRIIGLDTGYYSLKGFFGLKPNVKLKLHDWLMEWLRDVVQLDKDKRGIIFLSHHQNFSAFRDDDHETPPKQLSELFGPERTVFWFWGHEHRFAVYGCNKLPNGANLFARCIGHGGMPVELGKTTASLDPADALNRNLVIWDSRERKVIEKGIRLGHNGYASLRLMDNTLTIEHYDDNDNSPGNVQRLILSEKWVLNSSGRVDGVSVEDHTAANEKRLTLFAGDINNAIKNL